MKSKIRYDKKGSIQMSMQTIIVVVIGITLLTLGLKFVYDTFGNIGGQQKQVSEATQKQIQELFGESDKPILVQQATVAAKQGESVDITLGVKNLGSQKTDFSYTVKAVAGPDVDKANDWILASKSDLGELDVGESTADYITIDVPKAAVPGSYKYQVTLNCGSSDCDDGNTVRFILRVK